MMPKALLRFSAVCSFIIVEILAVCPKPRFRNIEEHSLEHFIGTWYTQAKYDELFVRNNAATCDKAEFSSVIKDDGSVDDSRIRFHAKIITPCAEEPLTDESGDIVKNNKTGFLEAQLVAVGLVIDSSTEFLTCSLVAGKADKYAIFHCCKEIEEPHMHFESIYYLTKSAVPKPLLTMEMHKRAKESGLKVAEKVNFVVPGACRNL